jgi:anaerobic carbon-monoxide dehydrogenase iron sulfur subunit
LLTVFVDPKRCIGCGQCEMACAVAHSQSYEVVAALTEDPKPRHRIHVQAGPVPNTSYPNKCRHCDPAPCLGVCPSGAIARDAGQDIVWINEQKCIACAMCAMVCPFDVITYHPQDVQGTVRTVAIKCDGCLHRVRKGKLPACVETCKTGALRFGDINDFVAEGQRRETATVLEAAPTQDADGIAAWRATGAYVANPGGVK